MNIQWLKIVSEWLVCLAERRAEVDVCWHNKRSIANIHILYVSKHVISALKLIQVSKQEKATSIRRSPFSSLASSHDALRNCLDCEFFFGFQLLFFIIISSIPRILLVLNLFILSLITLKNNICFKNLIKIFLSHKINEFH